VPAVQRAWPVATRLAVDPGEVTATGGGQRAEGMDDLADRADFRLLLAGPDVDLPSTKHHYFLIDLHQPGIEVAAAAAHRREVEFFQVHPTGAVVPERAAGGAVGAVGRCQVTLRASARGSPEPDRVGWTGSAAGHRAAHSSATASAARRASPRVERPVHQDRLVRLGARAGAGLDQPPSSDRAANHEHPVSESSIAGSRGRAEPAIQRRPLTPRCRWIGVACRSRQLADPEISPPGRAGMPPERGGPRHAAQQGAHIEVAPPRSNKNVLAERVLGMPKTSTPGAEKSWRELPPRVALRGPAKPA